MSGAPRPPRWARSAATPRRRCRRCERPRAIPIPEVAREAGGDTCEATVESTLFSASQARRHLGRQRPANPPPCARSGRPPPLPPNRSIELLQHGRAIERPTSAARANTTATARGAEEERPHDRLSGGDRRSQRLQTGLIPSFERRATTARTVPHVSARSASAAPSKPPAATCRSLICRLHVLRLRLKPLDAGGQFARQHRHEPHAARPRCRAARDSARSARPPQRNSTRVPPRKRSDDATAIDADGAGPRDVRAAARGDVEVRDLDQSQRARRGPTPCASGRPRRFGGVGEADRRPDDRSRRPGWLRLRRVRSPRPTPRDRDRSSTTRRRDGSSRCARRALDRRRPTARAGRCAAACARSAAPSRSCRATRRRTASRSPSSDVQNLAVVLSTTSTTRRRRACRCRTAVRRRSDRTRCDRARHAGRPSCVGHADDASRRTRSGRGRVVETLGHDRGPTCRSAGSATPASAKPRARRRQLSQRRRAARRIGS